MDLQNLSYDQFELLCARLLQAEGFTIQQHFLAEYGKASRIDFVLDTPNKQKWVAVVKHRRSSPIALRDLVIDDLFTNFQEKYSAEALLLIVSTQIRPRDIDQLKLYKNIHIWDAAMIQQLLSTHPNIQHEFDLLIESRARIQERLLNSGTKTSEVENLLNRLSTVKPGEEQWRDFEILCMDILRYAFAPPLTNQRIQSRSEDGLDRRDAVYSIGQGLAFWDNLRRECCTRYVVAEFKNYTHAPSQKEVESIQQYLFKKAFRTFGILCSRRPPSDSAWKARRRAWVEFDKLILLLYDEDLVNIIKAKALGEEPTEILDAQLDDFFASLTP